MNGPCHGTGRCLVARSFGARLSWTRRAISALPGLVVRVSRQSPNGPHRRAAAVSSGHDPKPLAGPANDLRAETGIRGQRLDAAGFDRALGQRLPQPGNRSRLAGGFGLFSFAGPALCQQTRESSRNRLTGDDLEHPPGLDPIQEVVGRHQFAKCRTPQRNRQ